MKQFLTAALVGIIGCVSIDGYTSSEKIGVTSEFPSISPSGTEIVFAADFDGPTRLWISNIGGSNLRKVPRPLIVDTAIVETEPTWSPDGRSIVFTSINNGVSDIWVVQVDGTNALKLTANGANNSQPSWSPDGRKIVFMSDKEGSNDIWTMNADGTQQVRIVSSSNQESDPSFSPTGEKIVFVKTENNSSSLMIANADGTGLSQVTAGNYRDWEPKWGPNGIVFVSDRDSPSAWKIWVVQPDGSGLRKIGNVRGHEPLWTRDGRILFTDESMSSRAVAAVSLLNPATGQKQIIVDVQGYLTPIDIRPKKTSNLINPQSGGRVEVTILSTKALDAIKAINQATITFGATGAEKSLSSCSKKFKDVNGDGLVDLSCRFQIGKTGFQGGHTTGILRFVTLNGVPYEGRDVIAISKVDDPDDFKNDE